jgi:chemotaxis protein CheD
VTAHAPGTHWRRLIVSISDGKVSRDPEATLITYALGSCVGVMLFDAKAGVGGLLHIMLPESSLDRGKAKENPFVFADTGVPELIRLMREAGAMTAGMSVRLAGGAQVLNDATLFSIGKRNYAAVRKALWKAGLLVDGEAVGGEVSRTVRMEVRTGRVWVREDCGTEVEMPYRGMALCAMKRD